MPKKNTSADVGSTKKRIEDTLVENLVELQKIHTNLAEKIDKLTQQLSQLLQLFEGAARNVGQQPGAVITEKDKNFLEKIDRLLDQNKTIAKGLTMMEERMRERIYGGEEKETREQPLQMSKPLPKF